MISGLVKPVIRSLSDRKQASCPRYNIDRYYTGAEQSEYASWQVVPIPYELAIMV